MKEGINYDIPVICAECDNVAIHGHFLYCEKSGQLIYGSKPKWCPLPPLYQEPKQISIFDLEDNS